MTFLLPLLFCLLALCGAARMQSYIDTDYVAVLAAAETQISTITLAVRRSQTNDVARGAVSGVSRPSTQFGTSTVTFSSSMDLYHGGLFLINDTSYGPPTCPYSINASLSGVFDFSSNGWLAHPNTTVTTLPSGLLLFVLVCDSVYNQTTGNYTNTNVGWCYDMSINSGYASSALALGEEFSMELIVDPTASTPVELVVAGSTFKSSYAFLNFTPVAQAPFTDADKLCVTGTRCTNNTSPLKIELYRQHGNSTLFKQLNNTNLASLAGEVDWLCNYHAKSPLISKYTLVVDGRWSQYELCNAGQCTVTDFPSAFGVGHQLNDGTPSCKLHDAQEPNDANVTCAKGSSCDAGAWYSFPSLGACPVGCPIGTNHCTWQQTYKTIKTITLACLKGLTSNFDCTNKQIGFMASELARAFKSCPDVSSSIGDELSAKEFFASDQRMPIRSNKKHKK
jgi:hypothetical protein